VYGEVMVATAILQKQQIDREYAKYILG